MIDRDRFFVERSKGVFSCRYRRWVQSLLLSRAVADVDAAAAASQRKASGQGLSLGSRRG